MASKSTIDPFLQMEEAQKNMVYEISTDRELLLYLRSNNFDPLNDTDSTVLRDIANPKKYMQYTGYDVEDNASHRIYLTSNNVPTVTNDSKIMIFPQITNIGLTSEGNTYYMRFDVRFEVWIHSKLWVVENGFRWSRILSRLHKIYNKKRNSISNNTPPLSGIRFSYPKNGWNGMIMDYKFTTMNFLVE